MKLTLRLLAGFMAVAAAGCVEFPPIEGDIIEAPGDTDATEESYSGPLSQVSIAANDLLEATSYEGVEVCSLTYPSALGCAVTDGESALVTMTVPRVEQLMVMRDPDPKADPLTDDNAFYPTLAPLAVNKPSHTFLLPILRGDYLNLLVDAVEGTEPDLSLGHIGISVSENGLATSPRVADVTFTTDCPSDGVFYVHGTLVIEREPAGTDLERGMATVLNVNADVQQCRVVASHPDRPGCRVFGPGWQDPKDPSVAIVPVRPGHLSAVRFACPKPE